MPFFPEHKVHFVMVVGRDFSFLLLQEYCHDTFKLSAYPLADTHRYYHYPVCAGVGLYRSLFNGALSAKLDAPVSQVAFSFGLLSLGLAISSSVAGKLQERFGVKRVTMASGILLGLGFFLTAHSDNLMMLWLSAGVLVGLADGAGYLLTLSNCVKWFPERKGLISAFAIGSYGLGSLGFKFIDTQLLETVGLEKTFVIWGAIALLMIVFRRNVNERRTKTGSENQQWCGGERLHAGRVDA